MYHQELGPILSACNLNGVGENVAYGYTSGAAVTAGWMGSTGHRQTSSTRVTGCSESVRLRTPTAAGTPRRSSGTPTENRRGLSPGQAEVVAGMVRLDRVEQSRAPRGCPGSLRCKRLGPLSPVRSRPPGKGPMTGLSAVPGPLTSTQPMPAPAELPDSYPRHAPEAGDFGRRCRAYSRPGRPTRSGTQLIEDLIALGRTDIPLARLAEGHIDALRILDQADRRRPRRGPLRRLGFAIPADRHPGDARGLMIGCGWRGCCALPPEPGCSIGRWFRSGRRRQPPADRPRGGRPARRCQPVVHRGDDGQPDPSGHRRRRGRGADQIGGANFYLQRPGFFPGGVGVAACWIGGAARVARSGARAAPAAEPGPADPTGSDAGRPSRRRRDDPGHRRAARPSRDGVHPSWPGRNCPPRPGPAPPRPYAD